MGAGCRSGHSSMSLIRRHGVDPGQLLTAFPFVWPRGTDDKTKDKASIVTRMALLSKERLT
jgi:hypothetical protein